MIIGTNDGLWISEKIDSDLHLTVLWEAHSGTWLTEEDAQKLVDHLCRMFELTPNLQENKQPTGKSTGVDTPRESTYSAVISKL